MSSQLSPGPGDHTSEEEDRQEYKTRKGFASNFDGGTR